ncbi:ATP-binding protein [Andreprevotia chitinilytica]|uniref:ATP-binding protein n=1 Tax=Andreprevotia chitinilytica TaxID=396808 RepID=UPI00055176C0|nr:ATP-binding protein [Andreprevotia chitinilytica]
MKLTRVRVKLLILLAALNVLLAGLVYGFNRWSFDRGFSGYLIQQRLHRLQPFTTALGEAYAKQGSWEPFIQQPQRLENLALTTLAKSEIIRMDGQSGGRPPPQGPQGGPGTQRVDGPQGMGPPQGGERRPGEARLPYFIPGLVIMDTAGRVIYGPALVPPQTELSPIQSGEIVVGYVGMLPVPGGVAQSLDAAFSEQQRLSFAAIALGMLVASVLAAVGIAHALGRPLGELVRGTHALTAGEYQVRLRVHGHDELGRLARDFNTLAETLAANRQARQDWLSDIAHELRTPLAVLRGEIEALEDGIRTADARSLSSLGYEVRRLSRLVEDLQLLAQSNAGALTYAKKPVEIGVLIDEMIQHHQPVLQQAGMTVSRSGGTPAVVFADPARLVQLFDNLLQNSVRYTDAPGQLAISLRCDATAVFVEWEDSAPGVSSADLPRLTERLYRVEHSRSRESGGSGLGLSIANAIATAHDSTLTPSHSHLGGLRWTLRLPLYTEVNPT